MKRRVVITTVVGVLALTGIAFAAREHFEGDELSGQKIALQQVPKGALTGAAEQLASVRDAEIVKLKSGRTVYELKGATHTGEAAEVYVSAGGQVIRTEGADDDD